MKIITANVNGIIAAKKKDFLYHPLFVNTLLTFVFIFHFPFSFASFILLCAFCRCCVYMCVFFFVKTRHLTP